MDRLRYFIIIMKKIFVNGEIACIISVSLSFLY